MPRLPQAPRLRTPFVTIREAAFFLQDKQTRVRYLFETGQLPRVLLDDGADFTPVGKLLISARGLWPLLSIQAQEAFLKWQQGHGTVPRVARTDDPPALQALFGSRDA